MKKNFFLILGLLSVFVFAEEFDSLIPSKMTITERSDYSVYIDGKYKGLSSREARLYLNAKTALPKTEYSGEAFVLQKTKHNQKKVLASLDKVLPIHFSLDLSEEPENPYQPQEFTKDEGYPLFRNFPVLPNRRFTEHDIGKKWQGKSTVAVKPDPERPVTRIPIYVEYEYRGITAHNERKVHHIKALFGVRYRGSDEAGDPEMTHSQGSRSVDIYLDFNNQPVFIREKIEEKFFYADNRRIKRRGFLLHFYTNSGKFIKGNSGTTLIAKNPVPSENDLNDKFPTEKEPDSNYSLEKKSNSDYPIVSNETPEFSEPEKIKPTKNFDVLKTERGTVLNLKNLNFVADKAILLKGEDKKLKEIASILKTVKAGFFMVEGHTADIGNYEEQKTLSIERAKLVVDELVKLGVSAEKIIYSGAGGEKPIAPNNTDEGRKQNRRVEITIF